MRTFYDDINAGNVPAGGDGYMGYDDGNWPDADALAQRFPGKTIIRITVFASDNEGDMLDVEKGNATPSDAPGWVQRRRQAGHLGPLVYCSAAIWDQCRSAFTDAGVPQPGWFIASYPGPGAVIPAGAIGHQYASTVDYDTSVVVDYLPGIDPVPVTPAPPPSPRGDLMLHTIPVGPLDAQGNGYEQTSIPWDTFQAVSIEGSDPDVQADDAYWPGYAKVQNRGGNVLVSVVGALPGTTPQVYILATS